MPIVEFAASEAGPAMRAEAIGRLVDACDDRGAPVAFSCRSANCATCRVEVLEGAELLEPAGADELAVLARYAAKPGQRLACQAVLLDVPGRVRLRWVGSLSGKA
jgi:ferredoxin